MSTLAFSRHLVAALPLMACAAALAADNPEGRAAGAHHGPATVATAPAATDAAGSPHRDDGTSPAPDDVVTADDAIIQGSICVGLDCVNNESFGFDTVRLKENNTRIKFDDTSTGAGFPATDWQLTANDSANGGQNKFSIEDVTAATIPFTVTGNSPTHSLFVASTGKIGFRTNAPVLDLHMTTTDTPAIRFEQTNGGGFTAQTWDIGANEANWFVRDVTGGSKLPLRVRPGAPTSSVDISASGNVGIGTSTPSEKLDVDGNVLVHGTISQLSSRTAKENFRALDGKLVLAKLDALPISTWNYKGAGEGDRHLGPVAEDFHAAFGLGSSDHFVAPTDVAGVALASVKALQEEVQQRDRRIEALEARLEELEKLIRSGQR